MASHGYGHERASDLDRGASVTTSCAPSGCWKTSGGVPVLGYRAQLLHRVGQPVGAGLLAAAGYRYSSSIYPIPTTTTACRTRRGSPSSRATGCSRSRITTLRLLNRNLPSSGGGWLPAAALRRVALDAAQGQHGPEPKGRLLLPPWEIDTEQPRVAGIDAKTGSRHYVNIDRMERRLRRLLGDFRWGRMDQIFLNRARRRARCLNLTPQ